MLLVPATVLAYGFTLLTARQALVWLLGPDSGAAPAVLEVVTSLCATGATVRVAAWTAPTARLWPALGVWMAALLGQFGLNWLIYSAQEATSPLGWPLLGTLLGGGLTILWLAFGQRHVPDPGRG